MPSVLVSRAVVKRPVVWRLLLPLLLVLVQLWAIDHRLHHQVGHEGHDKGAIGHCLGCSFATKSDELLTTPPLTAAVLLSLTFWSLTPTIKPVDRPRRFAYQSRAPPSPVLR